jgi:hypothetical protein
MSAGAACAAPEVESLHAFGDGALHERPVNQHVRGFAIVLAERGCPSHLELIAEPEAAAAGNRLTREIGTANPTVVRKLIGDLAKKHE